MSDNYNQSYTVENDPLFKRFKNAKQKKGLSEHTLRSYYNSLTKLCRGNEESLSNMVKVCKKNQQSRVGDDGFITEFSPNDIDSAISIYLDGFINFCNENNNKNTTINKGMASIRSFLDYYDVKLPHWEQYEDDADDWYVLTKEDIQYVINSCNIAYTSLTTFLASTVIRIEDVCSLTIGDFMKATKEYHDFTDVEEFIDNAPQDMIGYWNFHPKKTQRYNIVCKTFNSPESSNYILQSLRQIKNEYIPKKNERNGLDIKLDKKSALFGSRHKCYLKPLEVKSVTRFYTEKNRDLYQWNVDRIDQKLKNGELTEDREEYIKKIPKLHSHAFRKFFINTIRKRGNPDLCLVLEGHKQRISTDKNYVKPTKDMAKEIYLKALPDLSIAPVEARIITDSRAEELEQEVKEPKRKLEEKEQENQEYKEEIENLKSSNNVLSTQIMDIQDQIDLITQSTNVEKVQEYIQGNEIVEKYSLSNKIIELFKDDVKNGRASSDVDYMESLICRAYNHLIAEGEFPNPLEPPADTINDERMQKIRQATDEAYYNIIQNQGARVSKAQDEKIKRKLEIYEYNTWKSEKEADIVEITDIIWDIIFNG